jgi:homoserine O-acetyltransferase/O-succinyltransferase
MQSRLKGLFGVLVLFWMFLFAGPQQFAGIGDLELHNGDMLQDGYVGYRIYGSINTDSSNIIVYPTWFGGTSEHIGSLLRIHQFIDTSTYAVLAVDALGNGISLSPSNYSHGDVFPEITIRDMALATYRLLEYLKIGKVHALTGGSMGGMQVFELISAYPGLAEKAVIYVGTPRLSAYDILRWEAAKTMIELGRKYDIPEAEYMLPVRINQTLNGKSPEFFAKELEVSEAEDLLAGLGNYNPGIFTADNFYCQALAISAHDISHRDNGDLARSAERIRSDVLIIVNVRDHLVSPWPALDFAPLINAKTLVLDNDRGHLGVTAEIRKVRKKIHRFLR